ncbi:rapid alkalinization factor [Syzygium oleosum]|uniref:rapid alkalinization factor n=1 Tax=Syzygium oleosum TaxID=219896 RepID=UPI0024B9574E|nr:rapid alkalinization factor [Syzygium oleosum]
MADASTSILFFYLSIAILLISSIAADVGRDHELSWMLPAPTRAPGCRGPIAECLAEDEFEMDSEINRRILATAKTHISYGALQPGTVPCSLRGASYYNCRPGAEANPYNRPCSVITQCRS